MNFLVDESVDQPIVDRLRENGHDVIYIAEMDPGISDQRILVLANEKAALLVTCDKDFGELVFRQGRVSYGVLLIRLAGLPASEKAHVTSVAIHEHGRELIQRFSVVTPGMIRIRSKLDA
ncbi:DUF5615 family PIN-like protein [Acidobacteria bacterium AH-259-G07]|nr:DUF5615 family PIN-like protein [Acidobacteria bacterium AH-259-G07]